MLKILQFFVSVFVDFFSIVFSGVRDHFSKFIEWLSHPSLVFLEDGHLSTLSLALIFFALIFIALIMELTHTIGIFTLFIILHLAILLFGYLFFRERFCPYMGIKSSEFWFFFLCGCIVPMLIGGAAASYLGIGGVSATYILLAHVFRLTGIITVDQFMEMTNLAFDMVTVYAIPLFVLCKIIFMEVDEDQDGFLILWWRK